jgi:phage shock protein A
MANTNYPSADNPQNRPVRNSSGSAKSIIIGVLAVFLLGTWGYLLYDKNQSSQQIQVKTVEVSKAMTARDSVQALYNSSLSRLDSITGSNNNLQGQLSDRQSEITKLKNQINKIILNKNATASDLRRAKDLIAELNGKINNLEAEVARLTGENQQLAASNASLNQEKQVLQTNLQTTTTEKDELAKTVDVASTFTASNIQITPYHEKHNGKEKVTSTAKRVDKLVVSFDVSNRVAKSGPTDLYVIVTGPNGQVVSDSTLGSGTLTTRQDGDRPYTFKKTIDYQQGTTIPVQVPLKQDHFQTGNYKIEVYQNGFKIAEGTKSLKKGGLFG